MVRSSSKAPELPPLVDASIWGRAYRGEKRQIKELSARLAKGLDAEIKNSTDDKAKCDLDQARQRLNGAIQQLIQLAEGISDRRQAARMLAVSHPLMFACADVASRIDRQLIPRLIDPIIRKKADEDHGRPGGKRSGKKRIAKAEKWHAVAEKAATEFLSTNRSSPTTKVTSAVLKRCEGLPAYEQVYRHLCAWRKRTDQKLRS